MKKTSLLAIGLVSLLGISACSSDSKQSVSTSKTETTAENASDSSTADNNGGSAATVPDLSGIPGLSEDCATYINAIASAFTPSGEGLNGVAESFKNLESKVPDDLKDDVKVLADGFATLQKLYEKYDMDYAKIAADPAGAALFSDNKFSEASANLSAWLEKECPSG